MLTTVELMRISVNDASVIDGAPYAELRAAVKHAGIVNQSYGLEVEDPSQLYWIMCAFAFRLPIPQTVLTPCFGHVLRLRSRL